MAWQPPFLPNQRPRWTPPSYLGQRAQEAPSFDSPLYGSGPIIDVTADRVELQPLVPSKPPLDQIPLHRYSRIIPAEFVQEKLIPKPLVPMAEVDYMDWHFDEPEHDDDNEVRVYVVLSREDIAIIKRWGYQHDPLEKKAPLFDPLDLELLERSQQDELDAAADPNTRAMLAIEHKQQLAWAREQEIEITIVDYLACPYRKPCENRFQATLVQRQMTSRLVEFKKKLDHHRGE